MPKSSPFFIRGNRRRNSKGVAMGVADLMIVIPLLVVSVVFLGDVAQIGTCREKTSFVLTQAANYAVALSPDVDPVAPTEKLVKELCLRNNIPLTNLKVNVEKTTLTGCDAISVKLAADVPLMTGTALPSMAHLQDLATAVVPTNRVCAALAINPYPYSVDNPSAGVSVYLPIIQPRSGLPVWQFPYDSALNNLHVVQGTVPPVPQVKDSYFSDRPSLY